MHKITCLLLGVPIKLLHEYKEIIELEGDYIDNLWGQNTLSEVHNKIKF